MDDHSKLLQKNEEDRKALVAAADKVRQNYTEATGNFLKKWFEDEGRSAATWEPDITMKLPPEEIKALKAEIKSLADRAPEIAVTEMSKCSYWNKGMSDYGALNDSLRTAAAHIAPILKKRGYRVDCDTKNGRVCIGGTLGEDGVMAEIRKKYNALMSEIQKNQTEKTRIEQQQQRDRAGNLWDSA